MYINTHKAFAWFPYRNQRWTQRDPEWKQDKEPDLRGGEAPPPPLPLQGAGRHGVLVGGAALLLVGEELDEVVNSQDGDGGFGGEL